MATMSQEWPSQIPDWAGPAAAWVASVIAAGGAKPAFDWWRDRTKDQREKKAEEIDAATELREELRKDRRDMRIELTKRDQEIDAVRREMLEFMKQLAEVKVENYELRATIHQLRGWLTGFYGTLQLKWKTAGLPMSEFPALPSWVHKSPDGPTASTEEGAP